MAVFTGNGAVGSPSFTFSSDTTTGFYRPDPSQIGLTFGGAQGALFSSGGLALTSANANCSLSLSRTGTNPGTASVGVLANGDLSLVASQSGTGNIYLNFSGGQGAVLQNTGTEVLRYTPIGGGYLRMASGTGGIQFNGDTAAANALDDYEEGTWNGDIIGTTVAGSIDWAAGGTNRRRCFYTKIGRVVYFHATFRFDSSVGTGSPGSGNMRITGLPYINVFDGRQDPAYFGEQGDIACSAGYRLYGTVETNTDYIEVRQVDPANGASATGVPMIAASPSRQITVSGFYFVV